MVFFIWPSTFWPYCWIHLISLRFRYFSFLRQNWVPIPDVLSKAKHKLHDTTKAWVSVSIRLLLKKASFSNCEAYRSRTFFFRSRLIIPAALAGKPLKYVRQSPLSFFVFLKVSQPKCFRCLCGMCIYGEGVYMKRSILPFFRKCKTYFGRFFSLV